MRIMDKYTKEQAKKVWLISDTHFYHTNIIKYCERPFENVSVMNDVLLANWNNTIGVEDVVYFLGDLAFGKGSPKPQQIIQGLNGKIIWVKGSHDRGIGEVSQTVSNVQRVVLFDDIEYEDWCFKLVHNPRNLVKANGWVIHGHTHNTTPFIDLKARRVNVSVEHIGYTPISLYDVIKKLNKKIKGS